jgi:hypothetical protein
MYSSDARLVVTTQPSFFGDIYVNESVFGEQQGIKVLEITDPLSNILQIVIGGMVRV